MVNYESFWSSLQLGKWRGESIQKVFLWRFAKLVILTLIWYFILIVTFYNLQSTYPEQIKFDYFSFASAMVGFVLAAGGIGIGFNSYFVQQQAKPEIITYLGIIEYENTRTLVTFFNKGETSVIRYIAVVALKERKGISGRFSLLPMIDIKATAVVFHGWQILNKDRFTGVLEDDVKKALIALEQKLGNIGESDIQIAIMAFDEAFDIAKMEQSISRSIIAGCKLGEYSEIIQYAHGKEDLPGLVHGLRTYISVRKQDLKRMKPGTSIPATIVSETPPYVADMDYEIWKKLDSIEKLLNQLSGKDKCTKKSKD